MSCLKKSCLKNLTNCWRKNYYCSNYCSNSTSCWSCYYLNLKKTTMMKSCYWSWMNYWS